MNNVEWEQALSDSRSLNEQLKNDAIIQQAQVRELKSKLRSSASDKPSQIETKIAPVPAPITSSEEDSSFAVFTDDDLQVIEGIGPKMEAILKDNGISNWATLASKSESDLRKILDSYGSKYKIIDPVTWAEQAMLASSGDWKGLIARQKELSGGTLETSASSESKVEKLLVKKGVIKRWKKDDLKAIEGIGPKIESLLHTAGIDSWSKLSETPVAEIQKILSSAGDRFRLADPGTWPQQASLAAKGDWKALEKLQDQLHGGK